ncbi:MAG: hypothetical protein WCE68_07765 [Anaerolineales bacterium]
MARRCACTSSPAWVVGLEQLRKKMEWGIPFAIAQRLIDQLIQLGRLREITIG